ncbi:MAG: radical SAM protein [Thermodesulfobacteriota bacterium]
MAGAEHGVFKEKLSPFLKRKREEAMNNPAECKEVLHFIEREYLQNPLESQVKRYENDRHYESRLEATFEGEILKGVEKLYRRTLLIEPTTVCAAHCRWCLRGQYDILHLNEAQLERFARYCGQAPENKEVREVLVTGGDPLMIVDRLNYLLDAIEHYAQNVQIVRIGTRVPVQDPARVNNKMLDVLRPSRAFLIEIATHINHPAELFPEVKEAYRKLKENGLTIYNQSVLLRAFNDNIGILSRLFDELRYMGIEIHYLFHCIPLRGMEHHRTSINRGLNLIKQLTASGLTSGRCKPMFTLLTDVGKVTLYDGTILERDRENRVLLQTGYSYEERMKWNPHWRLPSTAQVDRNGLLQVWYLDASEIQHGE